MAFISTTRGAFNGEWSGNMSDEWADLLYSFVAWCKRYTIDYTINTHDDGCGDGITIYMRDGLWEADCFAEYTTLLGQIPSWPDGELYFTSWCKPTEVLFSMWHD